MVPDDFFFRPLNQEGYDHVDSPQRNHAQRKSRHIPYSEGDSFRYGRWNILPTPPAFSGAKISKSVNISLSLTLSRIEKKLNIFR